MDNKDYIKMWVNTEKEAVTTWNRRTESEIRTPFDVITKNPVSLGVFLQDVYTGKIAIDKQFCHGQCDSDEDCPHELQCIIDWLNQPCNCKPKQEEK